MYNEIVNYHIIVDKNTLNHITQVNLMVDKLFDAYFKKKYDRLDFIFRLREDYFGNYFLNKIESEKKLARVYHYLSEITRNIQMASTLIYGIVDSKKEI